MHIPGAGMSPLTCHEKHDSPFTLGGQHAHHSTTNLAYVREVSMPQTAIAAAAEGHDYPPI